MTGISGESAPTVLVWCAVAGVLAFAVGLVLTVGVRRLTARFGLDVEHTRLRRSPIVLLCALIAVRVVLQGPAQRQEWASWVAAVIDIAIIGAVAWLLVDIVLVIEKAALAKHPASGMGDLKARHVRTQITLIRRIAEAVIITLGVAAALWTIPAVREIGAGIFASAGVVGIIAGLAAQTSLGNVFAGIQIAFADSIRIDDIVDIDGVWGRIEEIKLTYVVLRVWDGTCLILPCTYFNTTNFRNWTHKGTATSGEVRLCVDWSVPLDALREELNRVVDRSQYWDRRTANLVVDDASGAALELLVVVSAVDGDAITPLRWEVREALVKYLRRFHPASLPRNRQESVDPAWPVRSDSDTTEPAER
ncbi:mechanosensitive ion channel family protein [Nakamurella sp.]|uniref:mechanosensitive ion channel family protein n=1 Tax=Nakamurella sp. TaxID=1869182 RepID=UPI0037852E94